MIAGLAGISIGLERHGLERHGLESPVLGKGWFRCASAGSFRIEQGRLHHAFFAHYDGQVIVRDDIVDLPCGCPFLVRIETSGETDSVAEKTGPSALLWLAENALEDELPFDLSAQADYYLYGTPKRV